LSLAIALYSARAGVSALVQGLDVVHRARPRGWLRGWAVDFMLTLALIGALLVALATVVIVPILLNYVQLGHVRGLADRVLPWGAMFLLVLTCLSILYRFGPNVPGGFRSPGWISVGVIWSPRWPGRASSIGFSVYLANFNSYNRIYGSIGAVIILMMWLYLSVWAVLVGGAINAELDDFQRPVRRVLAGHGFADVAMALVVINRFGSGRHVDVAAATCVFCGHIFLPMPLTPLLGRDESRRNTSTGFPESEIFEGSGKLDFASGSAAFGCREEGGDRRLKVDPGSRLS
jgi:hypothetical protein